MSSISVVISAYNEEKKIEKCLQSAGFADEIIFVDNSSTDKTLEIAKKYTSKIFKRENNPMLNINKNFGISKASSDWILYLDADEEITSELQKEIKSITQGDSQADGYKISRKNIIFGKWIEHAGWYPDYQLRFFRNGKVKFPEGHVHEELTMEGKMGELKNPLVHNNFENVSQFLHKHFITYAPNEAEQLIKKGYVFNWQDAIRFPVSEFLSRFFARKGYKDGFHGLILSMLMSFYRFIIFTLIWEKYGFEQINSQDFLKETEKEFVKSHKEMIHWFSLENLNLTKNPAKKFLNRLRRKIKLIYA